MSKAIERLVPSSVAGPAWVGQATVIEQSRAIEEVRAAMVVAQQFPRNEEAASEAMRRSCAMKGLAERAFYAFPRGGEIVRGESVHLARELARCWRNVTHGIAELRRDDEAGISEMQAFAWDLETNVRVAHVFVVPHSRDTQSGIKKLIDLRSVYENNANAGARRVRECIFAVLPPWFVSEAKDICQHTLSDVEPDELATNIEKAVAWYMRAGITLAQLEERLGSPRPVWTGEDYAQLDVLARSIRRHEITIDEAFIPATVTGEDLRQAAAQAPPQPAGDPPRASEQPEPDAPTAKQRRAMHAQFGTLGVRDRATRLGIAAGIVGRTLTSSNDLTPAEVRMVMDTIGQAMSDPHPLAHLEQLLGLNPGDLTEEGASS